MEIVLVGGWKKASYLIERLSSPNNRITVIHDDEDMLKKLSKKYDVETVYGDASDPHILEGIDVAEYDVLISLAPSDATNLIVCQLATKILKVRKTFSFVNNPINGDVFKKLGVTGAISASKLAANTIDTMVSIDALTPYVPFSPDLISPTGIRVEETSKLINLCVQDLKLPELAILAIILRNSDSIIPQPTTKIYANDILVFFFDPSIEKKMAKKLLNYRA